MLQCPLLKFKWAIWIAIYILYIKGTGLTPIKGPRKVTFWIPKHHCDAIVINFLMNQNIYHGSVTCYYDNKKSIAPGTFGLNLKKCVRAQK